MLAPRENRTMAIVPEWIEHHCAVPDGFRAGQPMRLYDQQLLFLGNHYLVRGEAVWIPDNPLLAAAFVYARSLLAAPQKWGKNPLGGAQVCAEAEGPVLFAGWAGKDDGYSCADHGCGCAWEYPYDDGEPMGMPWPTPLIQIVAHSESQTKNTWDVLLPMIRKGPLADLIPLTGEAFIRLRGADDAARIETVTSAALSRLGARTTFVLEDQVEGYWQSNGMAAVSDTIHRNLAGIGGRAVELANAWDLSQGSVAEREWNSRRTDIYRQAVWAPEGLDFEIAEQRRRILETVYPLDHRREGGGHLDLDTIEAEAVGMLEYDPPQAKRWFGNDRTIQGHGRAFDVQVFRNLAAKRPKEVPAGALVVIGIDGSRRWDHFPLIATEVASGYQWPLDIFVPNGVELQVGRVEAVLETAIETFDVWRVYGDPAWIESWLASWAGKWGKDRILAWDTRRTKAMAYAVRAWHSAVRSGELSHCAETDPHCALLTEHVGNAVRRETGYRDDEGPLWTVEKEAPNSPKKIDSVPAAVLSWEARLDAIRAGVLHLPAEPVSAYSDENWIVEGKPRSLLA